MSTIPNQLLVMLGTAVLALSLAGCNTTQVSVDQSPATFLDSSTDESAVTSEESPEGDSEQGATTPKYADDPIVEAFVTTYNGLSSSPFSKLEKGNIRTKYHGTSHGYYFELIHAADTDKIHVSISQTNENASNGMVGMRSAFCEVAMTIDQSIESENAGAFFDSLISGDIIVEDASLGNIVVTFIPDKELSQGYSRGHIEVSEAA